MSQPVRTCVGCRGKAEKRDLLRVVGRPDGPMVDPRQIERGRGAYLHRDAGCLELAVKRKAFARALRLRDSAVVPDALRAAVMPRLAGAEKQPTG